MTRQAFPSILLSVAIVCFFTVALYRRDPHPPAIGKTADHPKAKSATDRVAVRTIGVMKQRPITSTDAPVPARLDSAARIRRTGSRAEPRKIASAVNRGAERSSRAIPPSKPRERSAIEPRPSIVKAARPALTVARAGETIADVARRVYGRDVGVEALCRANRDVVRDPKAAIAAGTVLKTPTPPSR